METATHDVIITKSTADDLHNILSMIHELESYHKEPPTTLTYDILLRDGGFTGTHPLFYTFIAKVNNEPVGYTIVFYSYSWEGKALLIEDLFVRPQYRKHGVGKRLMREIMRFANDSSCNRVDLHVLKSNVTAQKFYKEIGGEDLTETHGYLFYKFDKSAMNNIANWTF